MEQADVEEALNNKHVQRKVFINGTTLILWVIILGVILKPEKPHVILGTGEETTFTAEILPAIGPKGNVKIRFHRNDRVHAPLGNLMLAIFWKPGRWGGPLCLAYLLRMQRTSLVGGARCWWWTLESESRCLDCSYDQTLLCSPGQAVHSGTATLALLSPLPPPPSPPWETYRNSWGRRGVTFDDLAWNLWGQEIFLVSLQCYGNQGSFGVIVNIRVFWTVM